MTKHKWHDEIVAWAGGEKIEKNNGLGCWINDSNPSWADYEVYRIKPQPKEKKYLYVFHNLDEGKYEIGEKPHQFTNYRPIIGKIEVQDV